MTRLLEALLLVGLLAVGATACSDNVLRDPNSNYDPSARLPTNMM